MKMFRFALGLVAGCCALLSMASMSFAEPLAFGVRMEAAPTWHFNLFDFMIVPAPIALERAIAEATAMIVERDPAMVDAMVDEANLRARLADTERIRLDLG